MQLQPTQPMATRPTASVGAASAGAPAVSQLIDDEDEEDSAGLMPFAIAALVLGLAVLGVELISSQKYMAGALPEENNPYHRKIDGEWKRSFTLPKTETIGE